MFCKFPLTDKRDASKMTFGMGSQLNAIYEELRPIIFRLAEKLTKDDIIDINYEVSTVTFRFN